MGKELQWNRQEIEFEGHQPSCFGGIIHIVNHHQWHYVKRILHHKKHQRRRRVRCFATPKTISFPGERQENMTAETKYLLDRPQEPDSLMDTPAKAHIKTSVDKQKPEEKFQNHWILDFNQLPLDKLNREDAGSKWTSPLLILPTKMEDSNSQQKRDELCGSSSVTSVAKEDEHSDNQGENKEGVLEILKVKRELFPKIPQDPYVGITKHYSQEISSGTERFTKSRSFPVADYSSGRRYFRPSTLKHKQNETWSFPKGEKHITVSFQTKIDASDIPNDHEDESTTSNDNCIAKEETSSRHASHGWNRIIIDQFKGIKRRIKRAIKESRAKTARAEDSQTSSLLDDGIDKKHGEAKPHSMTRISSINESMEKYTQLFEKNFGMDKKLHHSSSLRVTDEDRVTSVGHGPRSFRRRLSLPDPETLSFLLNDLPHETLRLGMTTKIVAKSSGKIEDKRLNQSMPFSIPATTKQAEPDDEILRNSVDAGPTVEEKSGFVVSAVEKEEPNSVDNGKFQDDLAAPESKPWDQRNNSVTMEVKNEPEALNSMISSKFNLLDEENGLSKSFPPTGHQVDLSYHGLDESNSRVKQQSTNSKDYWLESQEALIEAANSLVPSFKLDKEDEPDYTFVRDALKLTGFLDYNEPWNSIDLPLDPQLFDELEATAVHDTGCSKQDVGSCCKHLLLFDLMNEVLIEIYDRSFAYYPQSFSLNRQVRTAPKGQRVLDEVWTKVKQYRSLKPELDRSLDDTIARDMAMGDGWMNLQWDGECVALEIEDLIISELLDEMVSS